MKIITIIFFSILIIISIIEIAYSHYKKRKEINSLEEKIREFYKELGLLSQNYIAYSEYKYLKEKYQILYKDCFLYNTEIVKTFKTYFHNIKDNIDILNEAFIERELINNKEYFDTMFNYKLDEEQRRAIITDDNSNLIIAGAGSGKTSTMIGKIKYLIEKKNVNPSEIISISFTNNAVDNFKNKLNDTRVECTTFHKLGCNIINNNSIKMDINTTLLKNTINEYLKNNIFKNESNLRNFIELYALYLHVPFTEEEKLGETIEKEKGFDLETLKSKYNKQKNLITLKSEEVKSYEELVIANYLFINGIEYEYEKSYEYNTADENYRQYHPDFYLKESKIYLEHFGIDKNGRTPQYNKVEERKYLDSINFKRQLHQKYNTKMIETYSYYFKNGTIIDELKKILEQNNIKQNTIDYKELYKAIINQNISVELESFKELISKFIHIYKGNNYPEEYFNFFIEDAKKKKNKRNILLLEIIKDIYLEYQTTLSKKKQIDFDDMINLAIEKVRKGEYNKKISYIIIDEFQDVSYSRYTLIKELQAKTNAKIIAVGDDWQSIFRFSGCDLSIFVDFDKHFEAPKILKINSTHRNSQELIDIAGKFIMANKKGQIMKNLKSDLNIEKPINIYYYTTDIMNASKEAINQLIKEGCKKIAILGRNNSDLKYFIKNYHPNIKIPYDLSSVFNADVEYLTIHKSKGLEYDGIIIANMINAVAGFPNKMSDDPVLAYVTNTKDDFLYEEERRLFYVALTRTKTKCALLVPTIKMSTFVKEIKENNENKINTYITETDQTLFNPYCPKCQTGKLIIRVNKTNNNQFVSCTNYPQCNYSSGYTDIINKTIKCPTCEGFLVERSGRFGKFYGCTNYPYCKQTAQIEEKIKK